MTLDRINISVQGKPTFSAHLKLFISRSLYSKAFTFLLVWSWVVSAAHLPPSTGEEYVRWFSSSSLTETT